MAVKMTSMIPSVCPSYRSVIAGSTNSLPPRPLMSRRLCPLLLQIRTTVPLRPLIILNQ
jgi:hypothetical protein